MPTYETIVEFCHYSCESKRRENSAFTLVLLGFYHVSRGEKPCCGRFCSSLGQHQTGLLEDGNFQTVSGTTHSSSACSSRVFVSAEFRDDCGLPSVDSRRISRPVPGTKGGSGSVQRQYRLTATESTPEIPNPLSADSRVA